MDPADERVPEDQVSSEAALDETVSGRSERVRARREELRARYERLADRAQAERERHESVDIVFDMADRDLEAGGGIIAGALAYRLFIWLLPLALVSVAGLGFTAHAASESPQETARSLGVSGLVSSSVANAAQGPGRWYALVIGIPVLVWVTRSLLRALIVAHRLLWQDVRAAAPKPTLPATFRLLALLIGFSALGALAAAMRAWSSGPGVLVTLLMIAPTAGLWLLVTLDLPHRAARWTALVPGAIAGAVGLELIHIFTAYFLAPYAIEKEGTYGTLGAAAALLLGLFVVSRLVVASAVLNATLWERRNEPPRTG